MTKSIQEEYKWWLYETLQQAEHSYVKKLMDYMNGDAYYSNPNVMVQEVINEALQAQLKWLLEKMPDHSDMVSYEEVKGTASWIEGVMRCRQVILEALISEKE